MAKKYKILKTDPRTNTHEFLVDDVVDLVKLPKETGSLAFMVNTGDLYVCNNLKEWKNVSNPDTPEIVNPSGTLTIIKNGTGINVTEYAAVDVAVPNPSTGTLSITENGENIDVTEYAAVNVAVSGGGGTDLGELMYCFAYLSTSAPAINSSTPDITRPDYAFLGSNMIAETRGIDKIAAGIKVGIYNPSVASVSGLYVITTGSDDDRDWVATFQEVTGSDISIEEVRVSSMWTQNVITWTMPELQENESLWIHYNSTK